MLAKYAEKLPSLPVERVATLSKDAIESYAGEGDRWKTIGGPIDVLLVTKTCCRWLEKNSLKRNWKYIQDLIREYRDGKLELNVIPPATSGHLEDLLATVTEAQ